MAPNSHDLLARAAAENAPPGRLAGRYLKVLAIAKGDQREARKYLENSRWVEAPRIKAAIGSIGTGDATNLLRPIGASFFEAVYPLTLLGRIANLRRVPLFVKSCVQTQGATAQWYQEGKSIGVSEQVFANQDGLRPRKVAAISVATLELARHSDGERILLNDLARACAAALDDAFSDATNAGVADTKPQSITNAGTTQASADDAQQDVDFLLDTFKGNLTEAIFVTNPRNALQLAMVLAPSAEALGPRGGSLLTVPVFTSESVPLGTVSLIDPTAVEIAIDENAELSVTGDASIIMDTDPPDGPQQHVSLFQTDSIGMLAIARANWRLNHDDAAVTVTGADYLGASG